VEDKQADPADPAAVVPVIVVPAVVPEHLAKVTPGVPATQVAPMQVVVVAVLVE
jgi:hypothetical protein